MLHQTTHLMYTSQKTIIHTGINSSFITCRRNIGESTCGDLFP
jgi:hypothetical protein